MNQLTVPNETKIPLARAKLFFIVVISFAFVLICLWLFSLSDNVIRPRNDPIMAHGMAILGAVFFGLCSLWGMKKLFDNRPGLQFNRDGIIDNSNATSVGFVPWTDITGIEIYKIKRSRNVVVKVTAPEKYVASGGMTQRFMREANLKMCGSPITLNAGALAVDFNQLVELFEGYLEKYKPGYKRKTVPVTD